MIRRALLVLAVSTAAALGGAVPAEAATRLTATVGPNASISLKTSAGRAVRSLKPGSYVIQVRDRSRAHNFHLSGPTNALNRMTTTRFVGTTTWRLTLIKGTYRFACDPHARAMKGSFVVK
jgi:plastocyanin